MQSNFKKKVLAQLNKADNEINTLLMLEGNIADLEDLPQNFVSSFQEARNWIEIFKDKLQETEKPIGKKGKPATAKKKLLSREDREKRDKLICAAYMTGATPTQIAKQFDITHSRVQQILKPLKMEAKEEPKPVPPKFELNLPNTSMVDKGFQP